MIPSVRPCADLVNTIDTTLCQTCQTCFNHDERMNPIDFGDQRSKGKIAIDIYVKKLAKTIKTKPLSRCISLSNLADILTMVRGVEGQGHNGHIWEYACEHNSH